MQVDLIPAYVRAVLNLRPSQVWWRLVLKGRLATERLLPQILQKQYALGRPSPVRQGVEHVVGNRLRRLEQPDDFEIGRIESAWDDFQKGRLEFLNESEDFEDLPAWSRPGRDRLWDLNLHYFDFALDFVWLSVARSDRAVLNRTLTLLIDWIASYPLGAQHGWEPYAISLRVVNWLKILCLAKGRISHELREQVLASVYQQCLYLRDHVEYHLQGNHLLENYRALLIAGEFFDGPTASKWRTFARKRFVEELQEEILDDGGHFERSPSYHCVVLDHVLDVPLFLDEDDDVARETMNMLDRMGGFLAALPRVDFHFPILNDCGANASRSPASLMQRLGAHGIDLRPDRSRAYLPKSPHRAWSLPDTGLYVIEWLDWLFIIDGGPMGPRFQPSHAHCDTLSFWLYREGAPILVEAGTFGYYNDEEMRRFCRSAWGHNTFVVDGEDHAEIWGAFRVGRRPHPKVTTWEVMEDGVRWAAEHDGYRHVARGLTARRTVGFYAAGADVARIQITDDVCGASSTHHIESFYHLSPDATADLSGDPVRISRDPNTLLTLESNGSCQVGPSWFCPEFGRRKPTRVLTFSRDQEVTCTITLHR